MNFPLLSRFSAVFWKYRFPGFSWNFTLSCTRFLASQEAGNPCAGGHTIDFQVGIRPKSVGWMVWTGRVSKWGLISTIQSTFFPSCRFCPIWSCECTDHRAGSQLKTQLNRFLIMAIIVNHHLVVDTGQTWRVLDCDEIDKCLVGSGVKHVRHREEDTAQHSTSITRTTSPGEILHNNHRQRVSPQKQISRLLLPKTRLWFLGWEKYNIFLFCFKKTLVSDFWQDFVYSLFINKKRWTNYVSVICHSIVPYLTPHTISLIWGDKFIETGQNVVISSLAWTVVPSPTWDVLTYIGKQQSLERLLILRN